MSVAAWGGWVAAAVVSVIAERLWWARRREARRVARACHELRGPLSAVGLGIEAGVRTGGVSGLRLRALGRELDRAGRALGDLAALPSIPGPVAVDAMLSDSVEAWRAAAGGRELRLRTAEPGIVWAERARLAQATGNLIANAIEHGAGAIHVGARAADGIVRIEVVDDGAGLPAPLSVLICDRARARWLAAVRRPRPESATRGLGLSIAAEIAAGYGGRLLSAPSRRGARLVLELPLAARGAVDLGAPSAASTSSVP